MNPVTRESWTYILPVAIAATLLLLLHAFAAGSIALLILLLFIYFFRDPERMVPTGEGFILAPADGKVVDVSTQAGEEGGGILISIFLSLWDVHVNRSPVKGTVAGVNYKKGSFHLAFRDEASVENEQNVIALDHDRGRIIMKQIAGLIARRVLCWVQPGEEVQAGQRIGLIKFGSRVDLIVPPDSQIEVKAGDKVKAGVTIVGYLK